LNNYNDKKKLLEGIRLEEVVVVEEEVVVVEVVVVVFLVVVVLEVVWGLTLSNVLEWEVVEVEEEEEVVW